jgi:hypothetical protein
MGRESAEFTPADDDLRSSSTQTSVMTSFDAPARRAALSRRTIGAFAFVAAISALAGGLTPLGEHYLPGSLQTMANSSGSWTLIAFAAIYLSNLRGRFAAAAGALSFVTMDAAFYAAFTNVGYYPKHYLAFWIIVAVVIGPLVGLSASWLRSPSLIRRSVGAAAPTSVLIGEGFYMLAALRGASDRYAVASIVVGVLLFVAFAAWRLRTLRAILVSGALCALGALAFFVIYGMIPAVLDKVVP